MPMQFSDILIEAQDRKARARQLQQNNQLAQMALGEKSRAVDLRQAELLQKDTEYQRTVGVQAITGLRNTPADQRFMVRDQIMEQLGDTIDPRGVQILGNDDLIANDAQLDAILTALGGQAPQQPQLTGFREVQLPDGGTERRAFDPATQAEVAVPGSQFGPPPQAVQPVEPPKPKKYTDPVRGTQNGVTGFAATDPDTAQRVFIPDPEGFTPEQKGGAQPKPTEGQLASRGFLLRMKEAEKTIAENMANSQTATDPTGIWNNRFAFMNWMQSPEFQLYKQASVDWTRAKLRDESGATIGTSEFDDEYETYWPVPGDSPEVIAQKERARRSAIRQLEITSNDPNLAASSPTGESSPQNPVITVVRGPDGRLVTN